MFTSYVQVQISFIKKKVFCSQLIKRRISGHIMEVTHVDLSFKIYRFYVHLASLSLFWGAHFGLGLGDDVLPAQCLRSAFSLVPASYYDVLSLEDLCDPFILRICVILFYSPVVHWRILDLFTPALHLIHLIGFRNLKNPRRQPYF